MFIFHGNTHFSYLLQSQRSISLEVRNDSLVIISSEVDAVCESCCTMASLLEAQVQHLTTDNYEEAGHV